MIFVTVNNSIARATKSCFRIVDGGYVRGARRACTAEVKGIGDIDFHAAGRLSCEALLQEMR